jgi:iron-sulfur cluster assembly accessory protein
MVDATAVLEPPLVLSERAARRINEIMKSEAAGSLLRISVSGGGCSGFQYAFDVVAKPQADDIVVERDGARVAIDEVSLPFLQGSKLDFIDDLIGQSFRFENPNATSSCGCGTSFSV